MTVVERRMRIRHSRSGRKGAYCDCGWVGNPRRLSRAAAVIDFVGHVCLPKKSEVEG